MIKGVPLCQADEKPWYTWYQQKILKIFNQCGDFDICKAEIKSQYKPEHHCKTCKYWKAVAF